MVSGRYQTDRPRFWRTPLDHDRVKSPGSLIHILAERCKGCSFCVEFCPLSVLRLSTRFNLKGYHPPEVIDAGRCVACHLCEVVCPEFAIFVDEEDGNVAEAAAETKTDLATVVMGDGDGDGENGR